MEFLNRLNLYANSFKYHYGSDRNSTFVRGLLKQNYKFNSLIAENDLLKIDTTSTIFTYICIFISVILFLTYVHTVFFPNFLTIINNKPLLLLSIIVPAFTAITLPFLPANYIFKNYLKKFGNYIKENSEFKIPTNASEKSIPGYEKIKSRVVKEIILGFFAAFAVLIYTFFINYSDDAIALSIKNHNYEKALKISNAYISLLPVSSTNYGYRAVAKYYLKDYSGAIKDYELANKYSQTNYYNEDIYIVKQKLLNKKQMIEAYNKAIKDTKDNTDKYSLIYHKANYLFFFAQDYAGALKYYDELVKAFKNEESLRFPPEELYFRRALTKQKLGDEKGYQADFNCADDMCVECEFSKVKVEQLLPAPSLDY